MPDILVAKATGINCDRKPYIIEVDNGTRIFTRTILIATGAQYRELPLENMSRFEGAGVYYGATFVEAQLCAGEEVIVIGGGMRRVGCCVSGWDYNSRVHMLSWLQPVSQRHVSLFGSSDRRDRDYNITVRIRRSRLSKERNI